jgi:hypothetical protein
MWANPFHRYSNTNPHAAHKLLTSHITPSLDKVMTSQALPAHELRCFFGEKRWEEQLILRKAGTTLLRRKKTIMGSRSRY